MTRGEASQKTHSHLRLFLYRESTREKICFSTNSFLRGLSRCHAVTKKGEGSTVRALPREGRLSDEPDGAPSTLQTRQAHPARTTPRVQHAGPTRRPRPGDKAPQPGRRSSRSTRRRRRARPACSVGPGAQTASMRPAGRPSASRAAAIAKLGARCRRREHPVLIFRGQTAGRRAHAQTHFCV